MSVNLQLTVCLSVLIHAIIISEISLPDQHLGISQPAVGPRVIHLDLVAPTARTSQPITVLQESAAVPQQAFKPMTENKSKPIKSTATAKRLHRKNIPRAPAIIHAQHQDSLVNTGSSPAKPVASESTSQNSNAQQRLNKIASAQDNNNIADKKEQNREAKPLSGSRPAYPLRAIEKNQQGRVVVSLVIDERGQSKNPRIKESSNFFLLDQAVLSFVEREHFIPAMQAGRVVDSEQEYSFLFVLE